MLKTGSQKPERLHERWRVYIGGEGVADGAAHGAFEVGVRTVVAHYDMKHAADNVETRSQQ